MTVAEDFEALYAEALELDAGELDQSAGLFEHNHGEELNAAVGELWGMLPIRGRAPTSYTRIRCHAQLRSRSLQTGRTSQELEGTASRIMGRLK